MDNKNKETAKVYIDGSLKDVELLFYNIELDRLKSVKHPFYDGGLTPIVMYYSRKYNLPLNSPTFIKNINGKTIVEICNNFYLNSSLSGSGSNLNLNLKVENLDDLFEKDYLKIYYFKKEFYNFDIIFNTFKDLYEKKQLNQEGNFYWSEDLPNILLALLILKENPNLGIKINESINNNTNTNTNSPQNKQNTQKIKDKFGLYYDYMKEITEKYLIDTASRKKETYLKVFWIYQILEPTSSILKKEGLQNILDLIKIRQNKKLWNINDNSEPQVNPEDYILSWIIYGLIKDYLSIPDNYDYFLTNHTLKEISNGLVYEGFTSEIPKDKKNKKDKKEKFVDKKENNKKVSIWWTIIFCFIIFPFFVVIFVKIISFFWSMTFNKQS